MLPALGDYEIALFKVALETANVAHKDEDDIYACTKDWRLGIEGNSLRAITALLLLHCPNLRNMALGLDILWGNKFLSAIVDQFIDVESSPFQKLKNVSLGNINGDTTKILMIPLHIDIESYVDWDNYMRLWRCPGIDTMEIMHCKRLSSFMGGFTTHGLKKTELKTLRITDSIIVRHQLQSILFFTPMLTRLEYEVYHIYPGYHFTMYGGGALSPVKPTLQDLKFLHLVAEGRLLNTRPFYKPTSFLDFPALKSLHIGASVLLGWSADDAPLLQHVLPPNLEELCLHDNFRQNAEYQWNDARIVNTLWEFINTGKWKTFTPKLKKIGVANMDAYFSEQEREDLKDMLAENGFPIEYVRGVDPDCVKCKAVTWGDYDGQPV